MSPIIETHGLTREFTIHKGLHRTTITAVDDLTITVRAGEAVGYIGANGAGKSTTIKMLTGILVPTRGGVRTCGLRPLRDRRELARHVGVVFGQRSQLWWDLPVAESFRIRPESANYFSARGVAGPAAFRSGAASFTLRHAGGGSVRRDPPRGKDVPCPKIRFRSAAWPAGRAGRCCSSSDPA